MVRSPRPPPTGGSMDQTHHALRIAATVACAATLSLAACSDTAITPPTRSASPDPPNLTRDPDIMLNGSHVSSTRSRGTDNDNASHGRGGGGGSDQQRDLVPRRSGAAVRHERGRRVLGVLADLRRRTDPRHVRRRRRRPVAGRRNSCAPWRFAVLQHQLDVHRRPRPASRTPCRTRATGRTTRAFPRTAPDRERRVRCCRCSRAASRPARSRTIRTRSTRSSRRARSISAVGSATQYCAYHLVRRRERPERRRERLRGDAVRPRLPGSCCRVHTGGAVPPANRATPGRTPK